MNRKIYLEGELALNFGAEHSFNGESVKDALRLIEANNPSFKKYFIDAAECDIGFHIEVGGNELETPLECLLPLREGDIIITPIPAGSKSGGGKILTAIAIAALLFIPGGAAAVGLHGAMSSASVFGALQGAGGLYAIAGLTAASLAVNLAITGIQQLMAPDPSVDQKDEGYLFNGSEQNIVEGMPIPLLYGELRVPGYPVSFEMIHGNKRVTSSDQDVDINGNIISNSLLDAHYEDLYERGINGGANSTATLSQSGPMSAGSSFRNTQDILFTDIISEGPIYGLVDGPKSVYLNDDPSFEQAKSLTRVSQTPVEFDFTNGSSSVTIDKNGYTKEILADTSGNGTKYIIVRNYGSQSGTASLTSVSSYDAVTVTASSALFTSDFVYDPENSTAAAIIRLLDSSSATIFEGYVNSFTSSTEVVCIPFPGSALNPALVNGSYTIVIDGKLQVASISGTSLTLSSSFPGNTGSYKCDLTSTNYSVVSLEDRIGNGSKYASLDVQFRTGNIVQPAFADAAGTGVGSIAIGPGGSFSAFSPVLYSDPVETDNPQVEYIGTSSAGFGLTAAQVEEVDEIRVSFAYGQLWNRSETNTQTAATVRYTGEISIEKGGSFQPYQSIGQNIEHVGLSNAPRVFEEIIDLKKYQPFTDFKIRITRTTFNDLAYNRGTNTTNTNYTTSTDGSISSLNSIIKENLSYPLTAMAKVRINSKDFQNVPTRTYHCKGVKVKVPSNYVTREEGASGLATYNRNTSTGSIESSYQNWDGNFRAEKVYTNNPAWVFYDILTNNRYGLGEWLNEDEIDKYALYRIARYCDELVPDGNGGTEPRFTTNVYFSQSSDAYKVVKDLATVFRSMIYWMDGEIYTIIDQPSDPIYNFSKANVIEGAFSYETTGSKTRSNQIIVTWNNPEANYKLENLIVEDRQNIIKTGRIISEEAAAFGATTEGQALRYGRWKLWTAVNQTELVSFKTALNAAFLSPGDVINVQDSDRYPGNAKYSGRISNTGTRNTTTIPLDRPITLTSGSTYELSVLFTDTVATLAQDSATIGSVSYSRGDVIDSGTIDTETEASNILDDSGNYVDVTWKPYTNVETQTVSTSSGPDITSLTVDSAFSTTPSAETVWVLQETIDGQEVLGSKKLYKILSISEDSKNEYSLTAVEFYNEKYAAVDDNFTLSTRDPVFSPPLSGEFVPAPTNAYIITGNLNSGQLVDDVTLYWDRPEINGEVYQYIDYYEVTGDIPGFPKIMRVDRSQTSLSGMDLPAGSFTLGVRTVAQNGQRSDRVKTTFTIEDSARQAVPRAHGMALGGVLSSPAFISGDSNFVIENKEYSLSPVGNPNLIRTFDGSPLSEYVQSCSGVASVNYSALNGDEAELAAHYIMIDGDDEDPLKLIKYYNDEELGYGIFYDAGNGSTTSASQVGLAGSVTIAANSNRVFIDTSASTTTLRAGDIIKFVDGVDVYGAKIVYVASPQDIRIDKSFSVSLSAVSGYKVGMRFNRNDDAVIYQIRNDSGILKGYPINLIINPDLGLSSRGVIFTVNPLFFNFDAEEDLTTAYTNLELKAVAIGYKNPVFKFTGTGFDNAEISQTADTAFIEGVNFVGTRTLDKVETYTTTDLVFDVTVAEELDANNVNKQTTGQITIPFVKDGAGGAAGKLVRLTSSDYSVVYETANNGTTSNPSPSGTLTFTATATNFVDPYFKFSGDGITDETSYTDGTDGTDTFTFTIPSNTTSWPDNPLTIRVGVAEASDDTNEIAFDTISVFYVAEGADGDDGIDGYTVITTNAAHAFSADKDGVIDTYAGSGTIIEVYRGTTELSYISSGTPSTDEWTITSVTDTNITAGSITASGNYASVANHSNMTATNASIIYNLNIEDLVLGTQQQSFSRSKTGLTGAEGSTGAAGTGARAVNLTVGDQVFIYDEDGINPSPSSTTVTAAALNTEDTVYYEFFKNDVSVQNTTSNTYSYSPQSSYSNMPDTIEVQIREGSSVSAILARDQLTISGLKDVVNGTDALSVILSNEAHTLPTTNTGTVTYTGSGTTIKLFEGIDELAFTTGTPGNGAWTVSKSGTNITPGSTTDSGNYATIGDHSNMTAEAASITYTISGKRADGTAFSNLTKVQSFGKSIQGSNGSAVDIIFKRSATQPTTPAASASTPSGWYSDVNSVPAGSDPIWSSVGTKAAAATNYTWQTPIVIEGSTGPNGLSVAELSIFIRSASAPSTPTGGSFTFPSSLTAPSGWSASVPVGTDPVYISRGIATSTSTTGTDSSITWSIPVISFQNGTNAEELTVSSSTVNGVTTLTFSDGTSATITDGLTKGVAAIFASNASGSGQSYTQGSLEYVNYYEYTGTKPSLPVSGLTWVKYVGQTGISEGVLPIYADDASGTNATFTYSSQEFINFYEWTNTAPTTVPSGLTYVKFVGDTGTTGATGSTGPTGATGANGLRRAEGYLYYQSAGVPASNSTPSGIYTWSTGAVSGTNIGTGSNQWNTVPPQMTPGTNAQYYVRRWRALETTANSTSVALSPIDPATLGHNFSGVVTFSSGTLTDGSSSFDPNDKLEAGANISELTNNSGYQTSSQVGSSINTNNSTYLFYTGTTLIDGGKIRTNTITLDTLVSNTLTTLATGHAFGLASAGIKIADTTYDTTAVFQSSHNAKCAALFAENIGNNASSVGLGAATLSGQAAAFAYGNDGFGAGSYGSGSLRFVSIANATNLIDGAVSGTQKFSINPSGSGYFAGSLTSSSLSTGSISASSLTATGSLTSSSLSTGSISASSLTATGDVTAFSSSDRRMKDNITAIENSLEKVTQLGGYEFDWNHVSPYEGMHDIGVIAQEVLKVAPEAVAKRENGMLAVRYEKLVPLLIEAIKELKEEVEELKRGTSD